MEQKENKMEEQIKNMTIWELHKLVKELKKHDLLNTKEEDKMLELAQAKLKLYYS